MNNYLKEIKAIGVFISIGLIIFGFFFILSYFKIEEYLYKIVLYYIVLCSICAILNDITKSKLLKKITGFIFIPGILLLTIGAILIPLGFLFIHIVYYLFLCLIIPAIFIKIIEYFNIGLVKSDSTFTYIQFTLTVFIAVLFNHQLRKFIYTFSPARIKSSKKLKPYELDKLTDYLLSENNVRFLIYTFYVFLLFLINFFNFEGHALSNTLLNDKAILQSFVTFIAFDRMLTLLKQLEFKPSDLLKKVAGSISNKFRDLEEKSTQNSNNLE